MDPINVAKSKSIGRLKTLSAAGRRTLCSGNNALPLIYEVHTYIVRRSSIADSRRPRAALGQLGPSKLSVVYFNTNWARTPIILCQRVTWFSCYTSGPGDHRLKLPKSLCGRQDLSHLPFGRTHFVDQLRCRSSMRLSAQVTQQHHIYDSFTGDVTFCRLAGSAGRMQVEARSVGARANLRAQGMSDNLGKYKRRLLLFEGPQVREARK